MVGIGVVYTDMTNMECGVGRVHEWTQNISKDLTYYNVNLNDLNGSGGCTDRDILYSQGTINNEFQHSNSI